MVKVYHVWSCEKRDESHFIFIDIIFSEDYNETAQKKLNTYAKALFLFGGRVYVYKE